MKEPDFWKEQGSQQKVISYLMLPLSVIYFIILRIKYKFFSPVTYKCSVPVICVGNITVGGTGKTPTAIAIADILRQQGHNPAFVTKGYKRKCKDTIAVDVTSHDAKDVGDEPLLLAQYHPCIVSTSRIEGCKYAVKNSTKNNITNSIKNGVDIIILDDGLQDTTIHKDFTITVIDSSYGFGNCRILPSGPVRDELHSSLKTVDMAIIIGNDINNAEQILAKYHQDIPIIKAEIHADSTGISKTNKYIAFAGIGRPQKFYSTLKEQAINICKTIDFSDHYYYKSRDIKRLEKLSKKLSAQLITTQKDAVRFPKNKRNILNILPIKIKFVQENALVDKLQKFNQ